MNVCRRTLLAFLFLALGPTMTHMAAVKTLYGFWGLSYISHINLLGTAVYSGVYKNAPVEFEDAIAAIDKSLSESTLERHAENPWFYFQDVLETLPQHESPHDYSELGRFTAASIFASPGQYLKFTLRNSPELFEIYDIKSKHQAGEGGILTSWVERIYTYSFHTPYQKYGAPLFLLLSAMTLALSLCDGYNKAGPILLLIWCWAQFLTMMLFAYGSYNRLRMPIDPILIALSFYCASKIFLIPVRVLKIGVKKNL